MRNIDINSSQLIDDIARLYFRSTLDDRWWLPVSLYLAKEHRLIVSDTGLEVDYSGGDDLELLVKAICHNYPHSDSALAAEIAKVFTQLSDEWYRDNYKEAHNRIVEILRAKEGRHCDILQPKELTQLAAKVLKYDGGSVYNPFAGICSYAIELGVDAQLTAQEIDRYTYNLARFNMLASGLDYKGISCEDSFRNFKQSDYIIATPPFAVRGLKNGYRTSDSFVLEQVALSAKKRAVVILPYAVLNSSDMAEIRQKLIEADVIDSIIALPSQILRSTGIQVAIVVIDKDKAHKGMVKMINLEQCYKGDRLGKVLDLDKALGIISNPESKHTLSIDIADIEDSNCDLRPSRYLQPDVNVPSGYKLCSLGDIVEYLKLPRYKGNPKLPKLSFSRVAYWVNELTVADVEGKFSNEGYIIDENALIISANGNSIRGAFFDAAQGAAVMSTFHLAFRLIASDIDKAYLMMELDKDYVKCQLGVGTIIHHSVEDILRLKILVPDIETQREEVIKAQKQYLQQSGILLHELQSRHHEEFVRAMRTRKHAIGQIMNQVLPGVDTLVTFIHKQSYKDDVVGLRSGKTLGDYAEALQRNLQRMSQMIDQFTSEICFPEADNLCVEDVVSEYIENHTNDKYTIELDEIEERHSVQIAKSSLEQILDNICDNAFRSGFTDSELLNNGSYRIRISCSINPADASQVMIAVANNGAPLSPKISPESVFAWGEGERTGIGGYEVATLVRHYGGNVTIKNYDNDAAGFTVGYEIVLPSADIQQYE